MGQNVREFGNVGSYPTELQLVLSSRFQFPDLFQHHHRHVTGLPHSEGNTVILTIVDRFSKIVHFVSPPKLPSAMETTNHLVTQAPWFAFKYTL